MSEEKELYEDMQPDAASEEKAEEILEDEALAEEATCEKGGEDNDQSADTAEDQAKGKTTEKKACSVRRRKIKRMKR